MTFYALQDLCFDYGKEKLLDQLNLQILAGDFVGVMGANGSGKTSLIRLLAGYLQPKSGKIFLQGKKIEDFSSRDRARKIAVVPQSFDVLFPFTVKEVVLMGRWAHLKTMAWETKEDLDLAHEAMLVTDCLAFQDRLVTELSGGEKERVLLARALAQQAQILLLDEPTTHLDLQHQIEIFKLLKNLHVKKNLTIITVLHDLNFAAQACQKILLLQKGRPAKYGATEAVLQEENILEVFGRSLNVVQQDHQRYYLPKMNL